MSIYTVCQKSVVSVTPDTSIRFVADLMRGKNLGCVVVAAEQKPVGIVTDRDLALRRDRICGEEADEAPVSTIMTREVCTIRKDTGIFDAIQEMKSSGVRRLPVADAGGRLVGLITLDDIIRLLARELGEVARIIGKESPKI